ncbi:unnamed protein product [Arctogadus glacialis]
MSFKPRFSPGLQIVRFVLELATKFLGLELELDREVEFALRGWTRVVLGWTRTNLLLESLSCS